MQEVAVVQGLQAEVFELMVALGVECGSQTGDVVFSQARVEQAGLDAAVDGLREVAGITSLRVCHLGLRGLAAQHFHPDCCQQQAGGHKTVVGLALDQCAGGQHQ
ncbi:hypothetical protein SDC9_181436 [bioreactor metagenome]|uniref:Uncharacterized protein n=1 Tax=bioreactor metagenome TaxID=1076179 RepID=A0A645HCX2_9ZZZZ